MLTSVDGTGSDGKSTLMAPQFKLYTLVYISLSLHNSSVSSGLKMFRKTISGKYRHLELAEEIRARRKVNL